MREKEFDYNFVEVHCADVKIVLIIDEKTTVTGQTGIHMHSFWELFYLQEGQLAINSDTQRFYLNKNQVLIIPPNEYHSTEPSSDVIKISIFFTIEKTKSSSDEQLFSKLMGTFGNCGFIIIDHCRYISMLLSMILENHSLDKFGKSWRMKANVTELMFHLYDVMHNKNLEYFNTPMPQNTYWVYKYAIDRLLDLHYMNDISLDQLSEKLYISPQNITRIISTAYGKTFNELKLELKMRNAKKLLKETDFTTSEIGCKIGYTTSRGFLSAFQKYEGCTPSEYRQKARKS